MLAARWLAKQELAASCRCSRNTMRNVLNAAAEWNISWLTARESSNKALRHLLFPGSSGKAAYRMPDYEYIHGKSKPGISESENPVPRYQKPAESVPSEAVDEALEHLL